MCYCQRQYDRVLPTMSKYTEIHKNTHSGTYYYSYHSPQHNRCFEISFLHVNLEFKICKHSQTRLVLRAAKQKLCNRSTNSNINLTQKATLIQNTACKTAAHLPLMLLSPSLSCCCPFHCKLHFSSY